MAMAWSFYCTSGLYLGKPMLFSLIGGAATTGIPKYTPMAKHPDIRTYTTPSKSDPGTQHTLHVLMGKRSWVSDAPCRRVKGALNARKTYTGAWVSIRKLPDNWRAAAKLDLRVHEFWFFRAASHNESGSPVLASWMPIGISGGLSESQ